MKQNDLDLSRDEVRTLVVEPMMNEDEEEIDLGELVLGVLRDWKILVVAAVLCALLGAAAAKVLPGSPGSTSYTASTTVYLMKKDVVADVETESAMDLMITYLMNGTRQGYSPAQDFQSLVTDSAVLQKVIDDLGLSMGVDALAESIELPLEKYTRMVRIDLTNGDAEQAKRILEHLCEVSIDSLSELMNGEPLVSGHTEITLEEKTSAGSGHSVKKLALVGGAAGFMLLAILSAVLAIFDKRLRNLDDIDRYLQLPVMATLKADRSR